MGRFLLSSWLPLLTCVGAAIVICKLLGLLRRIEAWKWLTRQAWAYLELAPPYDNSKTVGATEQLFSILYGLRWVRSWKNRLLGRSTNLSAEIVAKRADGIRFLVRVPKSMVGNVRKTIVGFLPEIHIKEVSEPIIPEAAHVRVVEFRQTGHFAHPLREQGTLAENDPMAYLTAAMSQLQDDEYIAFQLVALPAPSRLLRSTEQRLEKLDGIGGIRSPLLRIVLTVIAGVFEWVVDMIEFGFTGSSHEARTLRQKQQKTMVATNTNEAHEAARGKLKQQAYFVKIRVLAAADDTETVRNRIEGVKAALEGFKTARQGFEAKRLLPRFQQFAFCSRLPSLYDTHANVLSTTELASIYHFPYSQTAKPGNMHKSLSRTFDAPVSMKQLDNRFEVIIGENVHHGMTTPLGLTHNDRERHMYVIGGTGNGKTTLLEYAIVQDIRAGRGVGIIDPHGDMAEKILKYIPEDRINDVVYFDPDDIDYPVGLNLIEVDPSLTGSERLKLVSKTVDAVVEAFRSAFSDDGTGGHRIEAILRNGILTAMTVEGATLFTIQKLIRNKEFRKKVIESLEDDRLVDFWEEELGKAGGMQEVSMTKGITPKLDRLQLDPIVSRIFGQEKSTLNFGDILDGKIFICNLSKEIGRDNSSLLGTIILSLLQLAAEARARTAEEDRKPFYLYVDEFQNFASKSFTDMVAEARKYHLFVTMAEQTTSQQDRQIVETILGNVGVLICFRTGNPADEALLTPFFRGFLNPGEINNLRPYSYYVRLAADAQEPTSGRTIVLPRVDDKSIVERVKAASRASYARKYVEPEPTRKPKAKTQAKKTGASSPVAMPARRQHPKRQPGKQSGTKKSGGQKS